MGSQEEDNWESAKGGGGNNTELPLAFLEMDANVV